MIDHTIVTKLMSRLSTAVDIALYDEIINWLYIFTPTVENEDQEEHYIATLLSFVI